MADVILAESSGKVKAGERLPATFPSDVVRTLKSMAPENATHAVIIWANDAAYPVSEVEAFADLFAYADKHTTVALK